MAPREDRTLLRFEAPGSDRAVVLEDDGRVAYAYLLDGGAIVADVWLYNVAEAPEQRPWRDRSQPPEMPFLNPREYCSVEAVRRLSDQSVVVCTWSADGVSVAVDGQELARLVRRSKPGWSRQAVRGGPLARPLSEAPSIHEPR